MRRAFFLALLGLVFASSALAAQSLFGSQGLGMPVEPLDARARALGTLGVGLLGPSLSPIDLASAARIYLPSAQITLQPQWVNGELAGQSVSTHGTRFPQMGLAYPVPWLSGTALLHVGSLFDQRWEVRQSSIQEFLGESYPVTDVFKSDGGISTFQLGWAQRVGDDLSLGVGIGARMGSVTRTFLRTIAADGIFEVVPFRTGGEWQYSGLTTSLGFQWDPIEALRLGGTVNWSGDLKAKPTELTDDDPVSFDLPVEFRFGASGILTPRLAMSLGFSFADWNPSNEFLGPESIAGAVWSYGGGVEWAGPRLGVRNFPIRLGMRKTDLPFTFDGENPTERVWSGGIGLNLLPPQVGFMGAIDVALERGTRDAGSLSESFWRATMTFRVGSF